MSTRIDNNSTYSFSTRSYKNGVYNSGNAIGADSANKYITRFQFSTKSVNSGCGSSSLHFKFASGDTENIPNPVENGEVYVVMSLNSEAYINKCADDIGDALVKVALNRCSYSGFDYGFECTINYDFLPNTVYNIFIVPKKIGVGVSYVHNSYKSFELGATAASLTVSATEGTGISSISGTGKHKIGSTVTLKANLATGYDFSAWTGDFSGSEATLTFTMPAKSVSVKANATIQTFILDLSLNIDGVAYYSGDESVAMFKGNVGSDTFTSKVDFYDTKVPYGTSYKFEILLKSNGYKCISPLTVSGTVTSGTAVVFDICSLTPPSVLKASSPKFSNKITLEWSGAKVGKGLTHSGYELQQSVSDEGVSWEDWEVVSECESISSSISNIVLTNVKDKKFRKYRLRTIAKVDTTTYYSTDWVYCSPEVLTRIGKMSIYSEELGLIPATMYIHDDYGKTDGVKNRMHSLYIFDGTKWRNTVYENESTITATIIDNALVITQDGDALSAEVVDDVLVLTQNENVLKAEIIDNVLTITKI